MTDVGQPDEVVVDALGVPVGIPATGDTAARLRRQWSRALTDQPAVTSIEASEIASDDEVAHDYAVTTRVTLAALDATAGRRINLHAGAVADDEGRTLTVIGPSGSGKTTAIRLLAARLGYLSDETTSIDDRLGVHAHPKPLSVITDPLVPLHKESLSPDDLGLVLPPDEAWLHRIVLLHRGTDDDGLVPLDQAHAIAEIVEQTSSLARLDHPILRLADTIDACGGVWGLSYTEFESWIDDLVDLLDLEGQPPPARLHHPSAEVGEPVVGAWTRAAWRDAVEYDDELVLMVDDRVHVLAGLGVVVWLALASPQSVDDLVAEAEALWGAHPEAPALVADALAVMAEAGMVRPPA
ncbi:hypothetical protein SAMN04489844_0840 [Nocardioides exalbidus]|uniref:Uncharacterized protein n=1 Tax=Nocardioides exalbidus TaxID=402596 RepID=A0A1H4LDY2_9ACTN|nr:hypothetical protein [Nocardioides exalbidus]SEB68432.1 hypothetical protein SAMN04489844_0840 [Nocardioides exalbidus]